MTCQTRQSQALENDKNPPEEFEELLNYLPHLLKIPDEEKYIVHLRDSFYDNYAHQRYQFAVLACHMLYMSSTYFSIWQIKENLSANFLQELNNIKDKAFYISKFAQRNKKILETSKSPFDFSIMKESFVFDFLKIVKCERDDIIGFSELVKARNKISHPNGIIPYDSEERAKSQIIEFLNQIESIQNFMNPFIEKCFENFLLENYDAETREHTFKEDAVRETLVHENYLSPKDIEVCLNYDIEQHKSDKNYDEMFKLFECLKQEYGYLI